MRSKKKRRPGVQVKKSAVRRYDDGGEVTNVSELLNALSRYSGRKMLIPTTDPESVPGSLQEVVMLPPAEVVTERGPGYDRSLGAVLGAVGDMNLRKATSLMTENLARTGGDLAAVYNLLGSEGVDKYLDVTQGVVDAQNRGFDAIKYLLYFTPMGNAAAATDILMDPEFGKDPLSVADGVALAASALTKRPLPGRGLNLRQGFRALKDQIRARRGKPTIVRDASGKPTITTTEPAVSVGPASGMGLASREAGLMEEIAAFEPNKRPLVRRRAGLPYGDSGVPYALRQQDITAGELAVEDVHIERLNEFMSPRGQSRFRNEIANDMTQLYHTFKGMSDADLQLYLKKGVNVQDFRNDLALMEKAIDPNTGQIDPNSQFIKDQAEMSRQRIEAVRLNTDGIPQERKPFDEMMQLYEKESAFNREIEALEGQLTPYEEIYNSATATAEEAEAALQKLVEIDDEIQEIKRQRAAVYMELEANKMNFYENASYNYPRNVLRYGAPYLTDPQSARNIVRHEWRHLIQMDPKIQGSGFRFINYKTAEDFLGLDATLDALDMRPLPSTQNPRLLDQFKADLRYFEHAGTRQDIKERTAFLSELVNELVESGYMQDAYTPITGQTIADYVKNVYEPRMSIKRQGDLPNSLDPESLRILEITEPTERNYRIMSNVINQLSALAGGVAVGASARGAEEEYQYGGKFRVLKK